VAPPGIIGVVGVGGVIDESEFPSGPSFDPVAEVGVPVPMGIPAEPLPAAADARGDSRSEPGGSSPGPMQPAAPSPRKAAYAHLRRARARLRS
jgi:hypothetical protein